MTRWLAIVAAEAGNPVVIFAKTMPEQDELAVHVRGRLGNARVQPVAFPDIESGRVLLKETMDK